MNCVLNVNNFVDNWQFKTFYVDILFTVCFSFNAGPAEATKGAIGV